MRILLTGKAGQLGWELLRTLQTVGEVTGVDHKDIDLTLDDQVVDLVYCKLSIFELLVI